MTAVPEPASLTEAITAARHGLRVHPLHGIVDGRCTCRKGTDCSNPGKHPRLTRWQSAATTDIEMINNWWSTYPESNAGLVTGSSSNVVVMDVDPRRGGQDGIDELESQHGPLPETVEVLTGGGGSHFYFKHPGGCVTDSTDRLAPGVEIKADGKGQGSNVVLPGSMHGSNRRYEWELSHHPDETPFAALPQSLLEVIRLPVTELTETVPHSVNSVHSVHSVTDAVECSLPRIEGERNRCIFKFCRALKSIAQYAEADPRDLRIEFRQWWDQAQLVIRTKTWDDSWGDFIAAWPNAWPLGSDSVSDALVRAEKSALPLCAAQYECPITIKLIQLCRELQRDAGDRPFHLSCPKAESVLGASRMIIWRRFKMLVADGVIRVTTKHTPTMATRYQYIGDTLVDERSRGGPAA